MLGDSIPHTGTSMSKCIEGPGGDDTLHSNGCVDETACFKNEVKWEESGIVWVFSLVKCVECCSELPEAVVIMCKGTILSGASCHWPVCPSPPAPITSSAREELKHADNKNQDSHQSQLQADGVFCQIGQVQRGPQTFARKLPLTKEMAFET